MTAAGPVRVGLIVNPIAGMGGAVGLKGTDGPEVVARARSLGATPLAGVRARRALAVLATAAPGLRLETCPGAMGAEAASGLGFQIELSGPAPAGSTDGAATRAAARSMRARGVDLILFAGGDGTARDVVDAVGLEVPVLGIPCGVKMHSGVFATSPEAAGRLIADLVREGSSRVRWREVEVLDIDEAAVRAGRIAPRLYGYARAPYERRLLQGAKGGPPLADDDAVRAACHEIAAEMAEDVLYLVGPGTTAKQVLAALGLDGTLLGVDAVLDRRLVGRDLSERAALALMEGREAAIIVGVTGGQGFVFGRGNQPIGAAAIRRAGRERITLVASAAKLAALPEPRLLLDTGDPALDAALAGYVRVRTAPGRAMLMRLET